MSIKKLARAKSPSSESHPGGGGFALERARKVLLPQFELTQLSDEDDSSAMRVNVLGDTYFVCPKLVPDEGWRRDGKPNWVPHQFNLYPLVLDSRGVPWAEANMYILSRLEGTLNPVMSTYAGLAHDLAAYLRFLEENGVDWLAFPAQKLSRPTYRFNGHLKFAIRAGEVSASTARRSMSSVVAFYRWLISEQVFTPENPPWKESDHYVQYTSAIGFRKIKKVVTTDVHVKVPQQDDPFDGLIDDGGKLRPLSHSEQEWLVETLVTLRNTEMTLIHLFSLFTGARIQTVLTLRVCHVLLALDDNAAEDIRLPVGSGTRVDTKNDKQMVLHIPVWLFRMLKIYALSERARTRRIRAFGGDTNLQYLFLSQRGAPLYLAKDDIRTFNPTNKLRYQKNGQGVRQFISERVVPYIREKYNAPRFWYQFHDIRATAGMNWTDGQLALVRRGESSLHEAREFVRVRMCHESSVVTDRYLKYRHNLKLVRSVVQEHEAHLKSLASHAMEGLE
ncbi:hypothetical protein BTHE68_62280 (plasmid) [Burkholderia sp. THE68]|uniref:site-specific integrase n=1 Tax=Burkholderia sp. THE68 TaxID=758782 RepID=UPI0013173986|nr:site-specific integrase [Burkholderia sp. THE68]BBU32494.1 hypothetical protein BTHE68_62280 [Burkholderia sp. THE68]